MRVEETDFADQAIEKLITQLNSKANEVALREKDNSVRQRKYVIVILVGHDASIMERLAGCEAAKVNVKHVSHYWSDISD